MKVTLASDVPVRPLLAAPPWQAGGRGPPTGNQGARESEEDLSWADVRVLLVEDNPGDVVLFREYVGDIHDERFGIRHAESVQAAKRILAQAEFDVIALDLGLPDSSGIETLAALLPAPAPVVVLTGRQDSALGAVCLEFGAQDYLPKAELTPAGLRRSLGFAVARGRQASQVRSLVENAADGMLVVDAEGRVRFANPAAERFYGKSREQLVGGEFGFPIGDRPAATVEISAGGTTRTAEMRVAPLRWQGSAAWLATLRDVTDRRRAEDLEKRLYHADRLAAIGKIAAGVAHEINNPAAVIMANHKCMALDLFQLRQSGADELRIRGLEDMLEDNSQAITRVARITNSLRTFSRADDSTVRNVDLNQVVRSVAAMTSNTFRARARLVLSLTPLPFLAADPARIAQVVTNLILNAQQAIPEGQPEANRVTVNTGHDSRGVYVRVSDTGAGIPPEHVGRIFDPFYTTKGKGGTGLGLSISREIAQSHGGDLSAAPGENGGSVFELRIPLETGLEAVEEQASEEASAPRRRILIADDEPLVLRSLARLLAPRHQVVCAPGGREALEEVREDPTFDIIICDLEMPDVDGAAFYEALQTEAPELVPRVVFSTGGAFTDRARDFLRTVCPRQLEKPLSWHALNRLLEEEVP